MSFIRAKSKLKFNMILYFQRTGINLPYYHPSAHVTALDWSPRMVYQAREKVRKHHLYHVDKIMVGDIMRLSIYFGPESFNIVTSTRVFCSIPDPIIGFREIAKILKPSGLLIQLEHGSSNFRLMNLFMKPIDLITVKLGGYHITRNTLKNLKKAGFKTIHYWPLNSTGTVRLIVSKLELFKKVKL